MGTRSRAPRFPDSGPVEEARNRLLRRVDWRFLLPDSAPERVVCFAPHLREGMRATAPIVDDDVTAPGRYDVAVAQNPNRRLAERAWAALRPGGAFYSEWIASHPGHLARLRSELHSIGFEDVAFYWFWPWGTSLRSQVWLPLECAAARRYFFATRPPMPQSVTGVLQRLGRAAWRILLRTGFHPVAAIARKPYDASASVGADDLGRSVEGAWSSWGFGSSPQRLRWVLLTGGPRSISKPVGLVFADGESAPRVAVKFARVPESSAPIRNEAATLQSLPHPSRAADAAPKVLFVHDRPHGVVVGESVVDGAPLWTALRWSTADDLAGAGTRWLCDLAGQQAPVESSGWWERLVAAPAREFTRLYQEVLSDRELEDAERRVATLGRLPLVCEHRDFAPWNVLLARDRELRVLDWESAEVRGLPLRDLVYFLAYCGFFLEGAMKSGQFAATYRRLLDPTTRLGALASRQTTVYCEALRIPPEAAHPLRLLTWMVHSFSEYRSAAADVGGEPSAERLRSFLFLALWREELHAGAAR